MTTMRGDAGARLSRDDDVLSRSAPDLQFRHSLSSSSSGPPPSTGYQGGGGGSVLNTSTKSGGITFQRANASSSDPVTEMEVLKNIILREGYLEKLRVIVHQEKQRTLLRHEVIDLLDLLRVSTVECIEAIVKWRRTLLKPYPFIWNGVNYLLKIPSDMDFLSTPAKGGTNLLTEWLGFELRRNPFIIPLKLDERPDTPREERNGARGGVDGFSEIGAESTGGKNIAVLKHRCV